MQARSIRTTVMLLVAIVCAACGGGGRAPEATATAAASAAGAAPAINQDFPDPDTLQVDGTYYAYATQPARAGHNVQVATSNDLESWELLEDDPLPQLPKWAAPGRTWAPEVTAVADRFVLYFTARSIDPDMQCIGVATARQPLGPFRPVGSKPLVCPQAQGGAIDAASFVDEDGTRYLLWKNDGNCCGKDTWIYLQTTSQDGLTLTGKPHRLIKQGQPWEGNLVEAPTLVRRDGIYVLLYSANDYSGGEYATGYASSKAITGPYRKAKEPLLSSAGTDGAYTGPGGQDVVTDADGNDHLVFHDWDEAVFYRSMHVVGLAWQEGRPVVTLPVE